LLESLVQRFSEQLLEDGPQLLLQCPEQLPLVMADIDRVEQVMVNLLGNAITYTETGSITIKVWTQAEEEKSRTPRMWIAVTDTGIGIAQEDLPHVFERFWRAEKSRNQHTGGTGIGLAISQQLIVLQGGEISVQSELGKGSTFQFYLPLA
jgi:signal transduction histidine kinase